MQFSKKFPLPKNGGHFEFSNICQKWQNTKSKIDRVFQQTVSGIQIQQQMETHLNLLNLFLKAEKFKMETPETIRTSLQQGEWVTSIDFKDAYFHIPIQEQSRKYLRFHVQGRTYQFKALPFSLSTAPLEFTVVAKEVKLMAIHKGNKISIFCVSEECLLPRQRFKVLTHSSLTQNILILFSLG